MIITKPLLIMQLDLNISLLSRGKLVYCSLYAYWKKGWNPLYKVVSKLKFKPSTLEAEVKGSECLGTAWSSNHLELQSKTQAQNKTKTEV